MRKRPPAVVLQGIQTRIYGLGVGALLVTGTIEPEAAGLADQVITAADDVGARAKIEDIPLIIPRDDGVLHEHSGRRARKIDVDLNDEANPGSVRDCAVFEGHPIAISFDVDAVLSVAADRDLLHPHGVVRAVDVKAVVKVGQE